MAFLTIAGADYWVLETGADESTPEKGGQSRRAIDGTKRSGAFWHKRNFRFQLEPLSPAALEVLQAAVRAGTFLAVTGDAVPNGDYEIELDSASFERTSDTAYKRGPSITLSQV